MPTLAKDARLHIRCDQEMRHLLDKAAAYAHMSVSEFVLNHALAQALSVVQAHEAISLSPQILPRFWMRWMLPLRAMLLCSVRLSATPSMV